MASPFACSADLIRESDARGARAELCNCGASRIGPSLPVRKTQPRLHENSSDEMTFQVGCTARSPRADCLQLLRPRWECSDQGGSDQCGTALIKAVPLSSRADGCTAESLLSMVMMMMMLVMLLLMGRCPQQTVAGGTLLDRASNVDLCLVIRNARACMCECGQCLPGREGGRHRAHASSLDKSPVILTRKCIIICILVPSIAIVGFQIN